MTYLIRLALIVSLSTLLGVALCKVSAAQDEPESTPQNTITDRRTVLFNYPDGCEKGYKRIVVELQQPMNPNRFDVECGKVVDDD